MVFEARLFDDHPNQALEDALDRGSKQRQTLIGIYDDQLYGITDGQRKKELYVQLIYLGIELSIIIVVWITINAMNDTDKKWISKTDFEGTY